MLLLLLRVREGTKAEEDVEVEKAAVEDITAAVTATGRNFMLSD